MLVDGYIRVSQVGGRSGPSFISPAVQKEQIFGWAKLNNAQVGQVFEELDESGARSDRPMLLRALQRVEGGRSQGIVVTKLDRFGRSLLDGLANIERLQAAGGTFISVQDGLDLGTPTGKLVLRVMLSMAEWELDRVRESWNTARMRAIARGVYLSPPPVGYRPTPGGQLQIDPQAAPVIRELFRRRAAGETVRDLCRFLEGADLKTARGNSYWVENSVRGLLRSRAYLGEARHGSYLNADAHEPLIDAATWQDAQVPRRIVGDSRRTPLAGLLRCAGCRMALHHTVTGACRRNFRVYRCSGKSSQGECPARALTSAEQLEPLLEEHFFRHMWRKGKRSNPIRITACRDRADEAEADLAAYRDNPRLLRTLGAERFEAGLAKRTARVEKANLELAAARRAAERPDLGDPIELETCWPEISADQRRELLSQVIDCVFIRGQRGPLPDRAHICLRGEQPVDMPSRGGRRRDGVRSFQWPKRQARANRLREPKPWAESRIHDQLANFLGTRRDWPTYDEFQAAGKARLWNQVMRYGGPWYWAGKLELKVAGRNLVPRWNEQRLRAALTPFLRGRTYWPTPVEFEEAGLLPVRKAVRSHGGVKHWAAEFGLQRRDKRRGPTTYWTEQRVDGELREFTAERVIYPTPSEFKEAGRWNLYVTIDKRWGHSYWAEHLALPRARPRRAGRGPRADA